MTYRDMFYVHSVYQNIQRLCEVNITYMPNNSKMREREVYCKPPALYALTKKNLVSKSD